MTPNTQSETSKNYKKWTLRSTYNTYTYTHSIYIQYLKTGDVKIIRYISCIN